MELHGVGGGGTHRLDEWQKQWQHARLHGVNERAQNGVKGRRKTAKRAIEQWHENQSMPGHR